MALRARFIQPRNAEPARSLHDVKPVRVVALRAIHVPFQQRMMLRQTEFRVRLQVTIETRRRIAPRIYNVPSPRGDVQTPRPVARFATGVTGARYRPKMQTGMRAPWKGADVIRVTIVADLVADEHCPFDLWRRDDTPLRRRT